MGQKTGQAPEVGTNPSLEEVWEEIRIEKERKRAELVSVKELANIVGKQRKVIIRAVEKLGIKYAEINTHECGTGYLSREDAEKIMRDLA